MASVQNAVPAVQNSLSKLLAAQGASLVANRGNSGGSVSWEAMYSALNKMWAPSTQPQTLAEVDAGQRGIDYRDLDAEYNNRYSQIATNSLTAAMINGAAAIPTQTWAPFFVTNEQHFVMNKFEVIALPFINTAPYGLGRLSTYKRSQRTASLEHVKRSFEMEGVYLVDPTFGPVMLQQGLAELATSARMTVCLKISGAIVDVPYVEELKRLHNPTMPFSHTRQMFFETHNCFLGAEDPEKVINAAMDLRDPQTNKFDTMIGPSAWINRLASNQASVRGRPMPAFALQYNTKIGDFLYDTYDGANAFRSIPTGDGGFMSVTENVAYTASADDPETDRTQTLRARVTLGEAGFMKVRDRHAKWSGNAHELDVGMPDHERHTILTRIVRYTDALENSPLFNNYDGKLEKSGVSQVVKDLALKYNVEARREVYEFFREDTDTDDVNDSFPSAYDRSQLSLPAMKMWRGICGFVTWDDAGKKVATPELIGDIEPKTLPPAHVAKIAQTLLTHGADRLKLNKALLEASIDPTEQAAYDIALARLRTAKAAVAAATAAAGPSAAQDKEVVDAQAEVDRLAVLVPKAGYNATWANLLAYYLPSCTANSQAAFTILDATATVKINLEDLEKLRKKSAKDPFGAANDQDKAEYATAMANRAKAIKIFAQPFSSALFVPLASESVDAFKARLSADALAAADSDELGLEELGWASLLTIVPDESLGDFLAIAHEVQRDGRELTAVESDAVASFAEKLRAQPRPTHVAEMLKVARTKLEKKEDGVGFAAILGQPGSFLTEQQQKRLANKPDPSMTLAQQLKQQYLETRASSYTMDAMDIDQVPTGRLAGLQPGYYYDAATGAKSESREAKTATEYGYSWAKHEVYAKETMSGNPALRIMYGCILNTPFNVVVCQKLASLGCELFRFIYARPFAQFTTDAIVVMRAGPTTMITGIGHFSVVSGLDVKQNSLSVHAEFKVGVVCVDPKGLRILPACIPYEYHGGRNTRLVRKPENMFAPIQHRSGTIALPVPVNETRHSVPLALTSEPAYGAPDTAGVDPFQKHSAVDLFEMWTGQNNLNSLTGYVNESYWQETQMATQLQRAICCYYNEVSGQWDTLEGCGPLGSIGRNVPQSASCYFNRGVFPTNYERLTVVQ